MAFMEFSLRSGETIDLYDAAFRESTLASNIELFHGFPECWPCGWGLAPEGQSMAAFRSKADIKPRKIDVRLSRDCVAKVALGKVSKIPRTAGALLV
jgi:hypothetical protein